ncbi:MAG: succinate dehydrogenase [Pseudomonadota bacterium]
MNAAVHALRRNDVRSRNHPAFWAFAVHRVSGVLLTLFLPAHFWVLGQAIKGEAALDGVLRWTDQPLVKVAEIGLVLLLAAHLAGGLRLLLLEFTAWRGWHQSLLAVAAGFSLAAAGVFALNVA